MVAILHQITHCFLICYIYPSIITHFIANSQLLSYASQLPTEDPGTLFTQHNCVECTLFLLLFKFVQICAKSEEKRCISDVFHAGNIFEKKLFSRANYTHI